MSEERKVWLNLWTEPYFTRPKEKALSWDLALHGAYPGTGFFPSREAAEKAALQLTASPRRQGTYLGCVEVDLSAAQRAEAV